MKKGLLITFEGLDGSGKTTQIQEFISRLEANGFSSILFREPGGTNIGEKIRDILLDKEHMEMTDVTELLLYSSSRNQLCRQKIKPALEANTMVICDRFYDSTTAYQGFARGIDLNFINQLNMMATDNLIPDLTFLLDITMETRSHRLDSNNLDRLEQEHLDFHRKVRFGFLEIAKNNPNRFVIIDGTKPITEISDTIWSKFQEKIKMENKNENIEKMADKIIGNNISRIHFIIRPYQKDYYRKLSESLTLYEKVYQVLVSDYVNQIDVEEFTEKAINEALKNLDPYTVFLTEDEKEPIERLSTGNYGGVGIRITMRNDTLTAISPMDGGPAKRAGILPGDQIIKVDSLSTLKMDLNECSKILEENLAHE